MVCCAKITTHLPQLSAALLDRQSIKQQVKQLQDHFIRLAYCTYEELADIGISVHNVHAWLTSLNVFQQREHQDFINDHLTNIEKGTHLSNLWARLGTYWNFLNFDLLEHLVSRFGSENLKQKMESYKCDLLSFRKATRICDFIDCWPERVEPPPERELREFVAKVGYHWENCTLEDLDMLEGVITRRFFQPRFLLQLREIKPGSIMIMWLIPAPFVKGLQEAIESTSSEFFMEQKIETITVDGQECYPTPTRNLVEYSEKQLTSESVAKPEPEIQQSDDPSVGVVSEKIYSFKSKVSEEQAFPKETRRMRLAEDILSGEATSRITSESFQFDTQPGETAQETAPSSFLSKLKQKLGMHQQTIPSKHPSKHQRMQYTSDSPSLDEMEALSEEFPEPHIPIGGTKPRTSYSGSYSFRDPEGSLLDSPRVDEMEELSLMPKPHTHLGSSKPRSQYLSSTSEVWFDVRRRFWINPHTPAEKYVREKCVDEISRHVKLLPSPEQYLSEAEVNTDPSLPTKYKDYLSSTPAIRAALYTTFNANISAEVFSWSQHTESPPPTTMTELFTAFTLKTLVDHLSTHPVHHEHQLKVTTFSNLPTDVYKQFLGLCRVAYEGTLNRQQLVFSAAHLPTGFAPLGLMQEVPQLYTEGRASSYHFIHLTLQEYLAAVHISQLPAHEQTRLFQEYVHSGHFKMTMRFLAGRTKLANIPPDIMMDTKIRRWVGNTKLNFLFEAKDISMTTQTLGIDEMYVESHYTWTPLDYYVTGHAISHSNCPWRLKLVSIIDDENFELFCLGCAAPGKTGCRGHISYVHISGSGITSKSIQSFVNIPTHILQDMRVLDLSNNKLDGSACDLLAKNITIKHLDLSNNPIGEHMEGVISVAKMLVENKTLTAFYLQDCHISSEGAVELAAALCKNSTLKFLSLDHNPIGVEGASSMSDMLQRNTSLEYLYLCDDSVGEEGVHQLINSLKHNQTLRELWLLKQYKSETSDHRIYWGDSITKAYVPYTIM